MSKATTETIERLEEVPFSKLRLDCGTQARASKLNESVIEEYAEAYRAGVDLRPLRAVRDKKAGYIVWDGHHRSYAGKRAGKKTAPVLVRDGTIDDAVWLAFSANRDHGLRRSNEDKQKAIRGALRQRPNESDGVIAAHVGVDKKTVGAHRQQLEATGEIPQTAERKGADGRTRDVSGITDANRDRGERHRVSVAEAQDAPPADEPVFDLSEAEEEAEAAVEDVDGGAEAPAAPAGPVDANGAPVPAEMQRLWVLLHRSAPVVARILGDAARRWSQFQEEILNEVRATGSDRGIPGREITPLEHEFTVGRIQSMQAALGRLVPHVVCDGCGGRGCTGCGQAGWLSRSTVTERQRVDRKLDAIGFKGERA